VALPYAGQLAALGTASCWAFSSLAFEAAGRRIGALSLNLVRLVMAFAFLTAANALLRGVALPVDASPHAWLWLSLSGLAGFVLGDFCLFEAFLRMGPRLSMLMMALAPPLAAGIGWLLLGERLGWADLAGMVLTVTGISWAILDRSALAIPAPQPRSRRSSAAGVVLGLGAALGQAGGLVLSKYGMGAYDPVAATQVRVLAGFAGYAVLASAIGWWPRFTRALGEHRALGWAAVGAFLGPFLGVSLSLVAVQRIPAGVAASLMATTPVLIIPLVVLLRREHVGLGGVAGALVAVAGVVLLFL
jgi:drug/metabolite transporter (DMT)-like permease